MFRKLTLAEHPVGQLPCDLRWSKTKDQVSKCLPTSHRLRVCAIMMFLSVILGIFFTTVHTAFGNIWDESFAATSQLQPEQETWQHGISNPDQYLIHQSDELVYIDPTDEPLFHFTRTTYNDDGHDDAEYEKGSDYDVEQDEEGAVEDLDEYYATKTFCSNDPTPTAAPVPFADIPKGPQDLHIPSLSSKVELSNAVKKLPHDSPAFVELLKEIGVENVVKGAWGITYSFYKPEGGCKSPEEIHHDVSKLFDFEIIRVYDTDCGGVLNVMKLMKPHQKLFVGIYYLDRIEVSAEIIAQAVNINGGDWSKIHTVSVGNELVNFNRATTLAVAALVERARAVLLSKGYKGYVVTTDTLVAMLNHKELCHIGDYVSVNSHPYWDGNVHPLDAGPWLTQQLNMLRDVCGATNPIVLCETGWPTRGQKFGEKGVPSKDNQLLALKSIVDTVGFKAILFTAHDDYWKPDGSHGVEKFWGIFDQ